MEFIYFFVTFFFFDTVIVDWKKYWQLPIFPEGDIPDNSPVSLWNAKESVKKTPRATYITHRIHKQMPTNLNQLKWNCKEHQNWTSTLWETDKVIKETVTSSFYF